MDVNICSVCYKTSHIFFDFPPWIDYCNNRSITDRCVHQIGHDMHYNIISEWSLAWKLSESVLHALERSGIVICE